MPGLEFEQEPDDTSGQGDARRHPERGHDDPTIVEGALRLPVLCLTGDRHTRAAARRQVRTLHPVAIDPKGERNRGSHQGYTPPPYSNTRGTVTPVGEEGGGVKHNPSRSTRPGGH